MSIILWSLISSFLLEGIVSNFISINTNFLAPTFTVIALIIVYPFFTGNDLEYLIVSFLYGFLYDLVYTDSIMMYAIIFLFIAVIIKVFNVWFSNHIINVIFITIFTNVIYRAITYLTLVLVGFLNYNYWVFMKSFYSSFILNIIYAILLFIITDYFSKKFNIRKNS